MEGRDGGGKQVEAWNAVVHSGAHLHRWRRALAGHTAWPEEGGELVRGGAKQQTGFGNSAPCVALSVRSPTIFQ